MSTETNSAVSQGTLTWFWFAARVVGVTLGILTLLKLATIGFGIEYKQFFQAFLDRLRDFIDLSPLLDPIEEYALRPLFNWLRGIGWSIPELANHWRYVFTLNSLLMLAMARRFSGNMFSAAVVWAFVCALVSAAATGTMPLSSRAVFYWPILSVLAFMALPEAVRRRPGPWALLFGLLFAAYLFLVGYMATVPVKSVFGLAVPSPTLFLLAITVAFFGAIALLMGLVLLPILSASIGDIPGAPPRVSPLDNAVTAMGLDVLGVMGGALTIGYLMMK